MKKATAARKYQVERMLDGHMRESLSRQLCNCSSSSSDSMAMAVSRARGKQSCKASACLDMSLVYIGTRAKKGTGIFRAVLLYTATRELWQHNVSTATSREYCIHRHSQHRIELKIYEWRVANEPGLLGAGDMAEQILGTEC